MKWIIPPIIIGLVGGVLDHCTDLHKVWCFLIGVGAFLVWLLIESAIKTAVILLKRRNANRAR